MGIFDRRPKKVTVPSYKVQTPGSPSDGDLSVMQSALANWIADVVMETRKLPSSGTTLQSSIGQLTVTCIGRASYDIRKS